MTDRWHGGKGSRYRKIDQKKYNENWERIFGKKKQEDVDDGKSGQSVGDNGADRSERSSRVSQD
jgi:hypothetical protein